MRPKKVKRRPKKGGDDGDDGYNELTRYLKQYNIPYKNLSEQETREALTENEKKNGDEYTEEINKLTEINRNIAIDINTLKTDFIKKNKKTDDKYNANYAKLKKQIQSIKNKVKLNELEIEKLKLNRSLINATNKIRKNLSNAIQTPENTTNNIRKKLLNANQTIKNTTNNIRNKLLNTANKIHNKLPNVNRTLKSMQPLARPVNEIGRKILEKMKPQPKITARKSAQMHIDVFADDTDMNVKTVYSFDPDVVLDGFRHPYSKLYTKNLSVTKNGKTQKLDAIIYGNKNTRKTVRINHHKTPKITKSIHNEVTDIFGNILNPKAETKPDILYTRDINIKH